MGQPCQAEDLGIFLYPESISVDVDSADVWIRNVVLSGMTSELLRELRGVLYLFLWLVLNVAFWPMNKQHSTEKCNPDSI